MLRWVIRKFVTLQMDVDSGASVIIPTIETSKAGSGTVPVGLKFTKAKKDKAEKADKVRSTLCTTPLFRPNPFLSAPNVAALLMIPSHALLFRTSAKPFLTALRLCVTLSRKLRVFAKRYVPRSYFYPP